MPRPGRFTPEEGTGWSPGPLWTGMEKSDPHRDYFFVLSLYFIRTSFS